VAAAAFKAIAENPEILKQINLQNENTASSTQVIPASERGQLINIKPKFFANKNTKQPKRVAASKFLKTTSLAQFFA
jgi:hypothetical protein